MYINTILPGFTLPGSDRTMYIRSPRDFAFTNNNLGEIITAALDYVFPIAGLILLFVIIGSGFQMMTSAGNEEATANAKKSLTNAAIGFGIIFLSFWIYQIIKAILGI